MFFRSQNWSSWFWFATFWFGLKMCIFSFKCSFVLVFLFVHVFFPFWFSLFLCSNWPLLICHFIVLQPSNKTSKNLGKWEKQKQQNEKWNSKTKNKMKAETKTKTKIVSISSISLRQFFLMLCNIKSIQSYCIISNHVISHHIMASCYVMFSYVILCSVMSCCIALHSIHYVALGYDVLCHIM